MNLIDTHAHLDDRRFKEDLDKTIRRAGNAGIGFIINVGSDLDSSKAAVKLTDKYDPIYAAVGIHPHQAGQADEQTLSTLLRLTENKKVVAIGEIGLDYHYEHSPRDIQQETFRQLIRIAKRVGLPMVIHSRSAQKDTLRILKEEGEEFSGVFHCFSGDSNMAKEVLGLGFYISFSGVITYKNFNPDLVKTVPRERLLIETDSPYLAPVPKRGRRNEPSYLVYTAQRMAEILGCSIEEVACINRVNANNLFSLEAPLKFGN